MNFSDRKDIKMEPRTPYSVGNNGFKMEPPPSPSNNHHSQVPRPFVPIPVPVQLPHHTQMDIMPMGAGSSNMGAMASPNNMDNGHNVMNQRLWEAPQQQTVISNDISPEIRAAAQMVMRQSGQTSPDSSTSSSYNSSPNKSHNESLNGEEKRKGAPYIPSYMDLSNGPEPCVVCGDAATGYHYRCMTCEGCKGFFRRTIQKDLQYHCKWSNGCIIDKTTRNQCQYCRFQKCVAVGMATDLVLNERQRVAKRKLIEDNREKRKQDVTKVKVKHDDCSNPDSLTDDDRFLIDEVVVAYEETAMRPPDKTRTLTTRENPPDNLSGTDPDVWNQLSELMTPSIVKVVEFSKRVPGFLQLDVDDQILLLKACCMEIMCLRAASRFDLTRQTLTLQNGLVLNKEQLGRGGLGLLVEPIYEFAAGMSKLKLDETEISLLAAVLLMQSDRTGLKEPDAVERLQDSILGAYKRYISEKRPTQPVHWAKILMKVTDLRTISTRHAERVLCIKLDAPGELPPLFLEMFDEGDTPLPRSLPFFR